ncbi:nuclear transport factor 2 family protein [Microbulbifer sp. SAOS-129_SWC]|uniref:nuclear transport factor 2 family protein n=1 Tax=Microbulbifer sp. SAOS-129_SWC TaxID=3145235 RepID=UPI0032176634
MSSEELPALSQAFIANYNRYAEGLDSKNWGQVRSCFADEVYIDYGVIVDPDGDPGIAKKSDDWVRQLQHNIGGFDKTRHTISNHRVLLGGESPSCRAYLVADHVMFPDPTLPIAGAVDIATVIGEYTNHYRLIGKQWKIYKSKLDIHWSTGNIELFAKAVGKVHSDPEMTLI